MTRGLLTSLSVVTLAAFCILVTEPVYADCDMKNLRLKIFRTGLVLYPSHGKPKCIDVDSGTVNASFAIKVKLPEALAYIFFH